MRVSSFTSLMPAPEEEKSRRPGIGILSKGPASRWRRLCLVILGILLGQIIIYGPSLIGQKVLLPLDILAQPKFYIPRVAGETYPRPQDPFLIDLVCVIEPNRQFAISEFRAGRLPLWNPYGFAGAPFIWPKFSPLLLFQCLTRSPIILAWSQLLAAIVGGIGMYQFCRRVALVSFWASAFASWCYPLTGFFILWQVFHTALPVYWLPWMLLCIAKIVRTQSNFEPLKLCALTTIVLVVSGNLDVAAQVVMVSGMFALWCVADSWDRICELRRLVEIMGKL